MKPMNFDFLRGIAKNEIDSPRVCSEITATEEMSPLGALIWNARVYMGLSQMKFAKKCNIDIEDIVKIEDENTYIPDIRTLYSISKFLKIDNSIMAELAGFIKFRDPLYQQQLYGFAASSRKIRDCSDVKMEIFEQYLAVLHERGLQK